MTKFRKLNWPTGQRKFMLRQRKLVGLLTTWYSLEKRIHKKLSSIHQHPILILISSRSLQIILVFEGVFVNEHGYETANDAISVYMFYRDEMYKRKLQRIKVRSFQNSFRGAGNITKWIKFKPLKLILSLILLNFLLTFLYYSNTSHQTGTSDALSQWMWGGRDRRYISDSDISWEEILRVLYQLKEGSKIQRVGLINFNPHTEIHQWQQYVFPNANHSVLHLEHADRNVTWEALYPEWIDEEEDDALPTCHSLPTIRSVPEQRLDLIAVKLPCRKQGGRSWSRDVARLHLQVAAANLAASYKGNHPLHLLFVTSCFPMPNLFTCKDLVARESNTWLYKPDLTQLAQKLSLPIGSCELALPLRAIEKHDYSWGSKRVQREAYATILHSAYVYVCGAIVVAQSIRMSGSTRDLVILVDENISGFHRNGLELAGWQVRTIQRIRNPKAEKDTYNEWNYSKFRLWQLTDYDKIIFIDSDLLILKNIDFLFAMPEISATGNSEQLFNSGVMVIEPSNCTFQLLMDHVNDTKSYNGGDQGYLNEIFTWWHRIPKHLNFLKHFWVGDDERMRRKKVRFFESDPPVIHVLHYLGNKPWMCFRDYDCNWNVGKLQEFANDAAHWRWWRVHDSMPWKLHDFCMLRELQKAQLEWDRREAEKANFSDGHWRIGIKDERLFKCNEIDCDWREKLRHWGNKKTAAARLN